MKKLFLKELRLNLKPPAYLLSILGALLLIPNYPHIVGVGYCIFEVFIYMQFVRENLSQEFSTVLPVKRSNIVHATTCVIVLLQALTLFIAALSATGARFLFPEGNLVGMDPNFAFFGVALLCLAAFNLVFLTGYYKTGYKYGVPLVLGLVAFLSVYGVCETLVQAIEPLRETLDSYAAATVGARLVVLAVGIVTYAATTFAASKIAAKRFEKVNL